jgi:hypothetical protein
VSGLKAFVFLAGVALTAAVPLTLAYYEGPLAEQKQAEKYFYLAIGVWALSAPVALCGVVLTSAYLRWPRALTRYPYLVVLFLILVANVVLVVTGGWRYALGECWDCGGPVLWSKALLPATLFIVIAPLAKGLTFRLPAK